MRRDERLVKGIVLSDELAERYQMYARRRNAVALTIQAANKQAMRAFGDDSEHKGYLLKQSLGIIREWANTEEHTLVAYAAEMWKDIAEVHAINITPPCPPITVYDNMLEPPTVYYEFVVKEIFEMTKKSENPLEIMEAMVV